MKAILALTCVFSAVVLISAALSKEECEAPHATPQCSAGVSLVTTFYYNKGTCKCESEFGCSNGRTVFSTEEECRKACPYGIYALNG
uniref:Putative tick kunitz 53 n=1 Tax=Ixodes ricinus TaxID=34613 RepID=V5HDT2_IXORI